MSSASRMIASSAGRLRTRCAFEAKRSSSASSGRCDHFAEFSELAVVADRQHQIAVAALEDVLRLDVRMLVAIANRRLAGDEVVHRLIGEECDLNVEHCDVDVLAFARFLATRERGKNADGRVHARS